MWVWNIDEENRKYDTHWTVLKLATRNNNIIIIIYIELQMGWHPVAAMQLQVYTPTVHKIQRTTYIAKQKNKVKWEVRAVPRMCELYPGICLTTEGKERKNLS